MAGGAARQGDNDLVLRRIASRILLTSGVTLGAFGGEPEAVRILFVGNSLTYTNDLPAMVRRIGELDGRRIETKMIAHPNFSLEDHLLSPGTRRTLKSGDFDVVVLQQGPSSLDESRRLLIRDVTRVRQMVPRRCRVAVLMVWPDARRSGAFDRVIESHRLAAEAAGATLIPAGSAWKQMIDAGDGRSLYSKDDFHPAPRGTFIAALETYRALVGPPPEDAARHLLQSAAK